MTTSNPATPEVEALPRGRGCPRRSMIHTIEFTLQQPGPAFEILLSLWMTFPVPEHLLPGPQRLPGPPGQEEPQGSGLQRPLPVDRLRRRAPALRWCQTRTGEGRIQPRRERHRRLTRLSCDLSTTTPSPSAHTVRTSWCRSVDLTQLDNDRPLSTSRRANTRSWSAPRRAVSRSTSRTRPWMSSTSGWHLGKANDWQTDD